MEMVAIKEFRYAGAQLQSGDRFEARDRDVKVLRAIKNARLADGPEIQGDGGGKQQKEPEASVKRTYKRRDMKAE